MNAPSPSTGPSSARGHKGVRPAPTIPDHSLLRLIDWGSYGDVWLARNVMGTYRAVKVVYRNTFDDGRPYDREYAGIRNFEPISRSHESQVDILHIGRNDKEGYFYYVMELADDAKPERGGGVVERWSDGEQQAGQLPATPPLQSSSTPIVHHSITPTLQDPSAYVPRTLDRDRKTRGHLPFAECLEISLGLANALKHLHAHGLVHRDIKPSNIVFVNGIPKLADIGLVTESEATMSYAGGSQGFAAPEGPGRPRGDLYSLGKVIYEMCTGRDRLEFPALPPDIERWPERPQVLELLAVSHKACEPDPVNRYASADQLLADLVMLQAGKSVRRTRLVERGLKWALVATAVALVGGASAWVVQKHETRSVRLASERELALRDAETLRMRERWSGWSSNGAVLPGWSSNALYLLRKAGKVKPGADLQEQAAATLAGWDARPIKEIHTNGGNHLAFDAQGRHLLMDGSDAGQVRLWDSQSNTVTYFNSTNTGPVWFASDGSPRQLVSEGRSLFVLLNPQRGEKLRKFRLTELDPQEELEPPVLAVSPDASLCAAAVVSPVHPTNGQLAVWETATGNLVKESAEACTALAFSPRNDYLATGDREGYVRVRTLPGFNDAVAPFQEDRAAILCLAFQRDVREQINSRAEHPWLLAAGDAGGRICIWQIPERRVKAFCLGSAYGVNAVAFSPDNMTLASAGDNHATLWDIATGRPLLAISAGGYEKALAYSPDGTRLAIGKERRFDPEGRVSVFELEASRGIRALGGFSAHCSLSLAFSHDGRRLAALAHNWEVGIWNLASNCLERVFQAPKGETADNAALAFSRDDSQLAFATWKEAVLWDLESGQVSGRWRLPPGLVQRLCFDPTGRLLLFQWDRPADKTASMCRVRDLSRTDYATPVAEFPEIRARIETAVLSQRGDFVVIVAGPSGGPWMTKVFNPLTGRELGGLPGTGNGDSDPLRRNPQTASVDEFLPVTQDSALIALLGTGSSRRFIKALSPDGRAWLTQARGEAGMTVLWNSYPAQRLRLGIDHALAHCPRFSPDGKHLAFGTSIGTVLVCDLDEITRRLRELQLGW